MSTPSWRRCGKRCAVTQPTAKPIARPRCAAPRNEQVPTARLRQALTRTRRLSAELRADEHRHRITLSREPDDGFVAAIYRWAGSGDLVTALAASDNEGAGSPLSPGDFVRW